MQELTLLELSNTNESLLKDIVPFRCECELSPNTFACERAYEWLKLTKKNISR